MSARIITWEHTTPSLGAAVVAIGVFDGVHLGHQALIAASAISAAQHRVPCVALTFDRDPDQVITPDAASPQLLALADKCTFLGDAGADIVLVIPFDTAIASMPPEEFVSSVLLSTCAPLAVHVGSDFRFGRFADGTVEDLEELGRSEGFAVSAHELVRLDSSPVTSTRIRALIADGAVEDAARLLGRTHRIGGMVVRGRGEGYSLLGVPTANILPEEHAALPSDGVYAGTALVGDRSWPAAISVGIPPTFPSAHDSLEAHLIGFRGDLVHRHITLQIERRIRAQLHFADPTDLARAIRADIAEIASATE